MLIKSRKRIALFLSMIMILSGVSPTYLFANDIAAINDDIMTLSTNALFDLAEYDIKLPDNPRSYTSNLTDKLTSGESGISFTYEEGLAYRVTYFIEAVNQLPIKVEHIFDIGYAGENVHVYTTLYTSEGEAWDNFGAEYNFAQYDALNGMWTTNGFDSSSWNDEPYNEYTESLYSENGTVTTYVPSTSTPFVQYRGNSLGNLGGGGIGLAFRYMFAPDEGNKIYINTSNISPGNIVTFTVDKGYMSGTSNNFTAIGGQSNSITLLEEIETLTGVPTHWMIDENGDLVDYDGVIYHPENAGSRPGIDMVFTHPQEIVVEDGQYAFRLWEDPNGIDVILNLTRHNEVDEIEVAFKLDQFSDTVETSSVNLTDTGWREYQQTELSYEIEGFEINRTTASHTIRFVQDDTFYPTFKVDDTEDPDYNGIDTYKDEFVKWPELEASSLLPERNIRLRFYADGLDSDNEGKYYSPNFLYTYLGFTFDRVDYYRGELVYDPYDGLSDAGTYYTAYSKENPVVESLGTITGLPVWVTRTIDNEYQIRLLNEGIISQRLIYSPDDNDVPPPAAQIEAVSNVYVVPADPSAGGSNPQPQTIGFDLTWSAPSNSTDNPTLDNFLLEGDMFYELMLYNDSTAPIENRHYIQIFRVWASEITEINGIEKVTQISVDRQWGYEVEEDDPDDLNYKWRYDSNEDTFYMPNIVLKPYLTDGTTNDNWLQLKGVGNDAYLEVDKTDEYLNEADYPADNVAIVQDLGYTVPGNYYLTIRAVYDRHEENVQLVHSNESNPWSLTLNTLEEVVPTVTTIVGISDYLDNPGIRFSVVDISKYVSQMFDPLGWYVQDNIENDGERTYEIFLYQDNAVEPADFDNDAIVVNYGNINSGVTSPSEDEDNTEDEVETDEEIEDETDDNGVATIDETEDDEVETDEEIEEEEEEWYGLYDMQDYVETLRDGGIVKFEYVDNRDSVNTVGEWPLLYFDNLDENSVYYIKIRTVVEPYELLENEEDETEVEEINARLVSSEVAKDPCYSEFSKEYTFTTTTKLLPPTADEQAPPAPSDFWIIDQPNNTSVELGWEAPNYEPVEGVIYYELMRSDDNGIDDELLSIGIDLDEILAENSSVVAWNTKEDFIQSVELVNGDLVETALDPTQYSVTFSLLDEGLIPNRLYYFYARTVITVDGVPIGSEWIRIPVTTSPVDRPINLQIEHTRDYDYEGAHEVVVSFFAPLPEDAVVPTDYDFEIAIKGEDDSDYTIANTSDSPYSASSVESILDEDDQIYSYTHFVYHITGLDSSTRYDIKVRIVDYTVEIPDDETAPRSLYSDSVFYRTEYDEYDEQLKDLLEEYLGKFDKLTDDLKNNSYWQLEEGVYKYKEGYLKSDLAVYDVYELVSESGSRYLKYYLPADTFNWANDYSTIIQSEIDPYTLTIRPKSIDDNVAEVKEALLEIDSTAIEAFYFVLELDLGSPSQVGNYMPLASKIDIDLSVAKLEEEDWYVEEQITNELNTLITETRITVYEELEDELLSNKVFDEYELQDIVDDRFEDLLEDFYSLAEDIVEDLIIEENAIEKTNVAMLLSADVSGKKVSGYQFINQIWQSFITFNMANGYAMEIFEFGSYMFAGLLETMVEIVTIAGGNGTIDKYRLENIFDITDTGLSALATKTNVYSAIAQVLSMPAGADAVSYLQTKGFDSISRTGMNGTLRQDEAIYLLMQLYETVYYRDVTNIVIKDRQSVLNIGAFQPVYREYVYAAVELGVVTPQDGYVYPSQPVTVQEVLEMITSIMNK